MALQKRRIPRVAPIQSCSFVFIVVTILHCSVRVSGQVSNIDFVIADSFRVASMVNVPVTFSFTPTAGGALASSDSITLNYPTGFFTVGVTPSSVSVSGGANANSTPSGNSSIVVTLLSGTVPASTAVTVTLSGLTNGINGTPGGDVNLSTTRDPLLSPSVPSGYLGCISPPTKYCPIPHNRNQWCPKSNYCPSSDMSTPTICPLGSYCPTDGLLLYTNCSAGTYNSKLGSDNIAACIPCSPGSYCGPESGQAFMTPCPGGTFNPNNGSASINDCLSCPLRSFCPPASSLPSCCPPGTYNDDLGLVSVDQCKSCPAGYHNKKSCSFDFRECCLCPINSYQPNAGSAECLSCVGQAVPSTGQTVCVTEVPISGSSIALYKGII